MKYIKIESTHFREDLGTRLSFTKFKKLHDNKFKIITAEEAYKKLGGKITADKEK